MEIVSNAQHNTASGSCHRLFIDSTGNVYALGLNNYGQCGFNSPSALLTPTLITSLPLINSVHAAQNNSLFVSTNGDVYACGQNCCCELGLGEGGMQTRPMKLKNIPPMRLVAMVENHTLFLDFEGKVWRCGSWQNKSIKYPEIIGNLPRITMISNFCNRFFLLDENGCLWSYNSWEKPSRYASTLPKLKSIFDGFAFDENESIWSVFTLKKVNLLRFINIFIHTDGSVWTTRAPDQRSQFISSMECMEQTIYTVIAALPAIRSLSVGGAILLYDAKACVWEADTRTDSPKVKLIADLSQTNAKQLKSARNL